MGEETAIEWTDHTFNPWWGCTKVSPGCDHCYAESWAKRTGYPDLWGVEGARRVFDERHWQQPVNWDNKAGIAKKRARVFCASMADVFDNHEGVAESRERLWRLIEATDNLDWLILTKRIGNVRSMVPVVWNKMGFPENLWLGISVVNQVEADRDIPKLLALPAEIKFLSVEPMLAPVDLSPFERGMCPDCSGSGEIMLDFLHGDIVMEKCTECAGTGGWSDNQGIDWVICGGESGGKARPMQVLWARSLQRQCDQMGISFFMKQGSQANWVHFKDPLHFPADLQVRQWPR